LRAAKEKPMRDSWTVLARDSKIAVAGPPEAGGDEHGGKFMGIESIIIWLIVGAIAGWLAGLIVTGSGFGLVGDIIVGIVGAVIAGWLLPHIGIIIGGGFIGAIINAFIGAVILLIVLRLIKRMA
jgi:uncharacterized membrane protein YeaQ/YmgE (transglycosylase-associated protein family)